MSKKSREKTPELEEIAAQLGSMNTQEEDTITIPVVEIFCRGCWLLSFWQDWYSAVLW